MTFNNHFERRETTYQASGVWACKPKVLYKASVELCMFDPGKARAALLGFAAIVLASVAVLLFATPVAGS